MKPTPYKPSRPQFPSLGVYALHAGDLRYRYVGTSKNIRFRLTEHRSRARRGHAAPIYAWMRTVGPENVQVVILQSVPDANELAAIEAGWIARIIDLGFDLLNEDGRNGVPFSKTDRGMKNLRKGQQSRPRTSIPCTVDGVEYPSITAASAATGISKWNLAKSSAMRS